ncbi:MAG: hypothetical protein HKN13_13245 [Rhodothermales bacterium]|nr:hypothetical protein [Rhodothermales bacterium]
MKRLIRPLVYILGFSVFCACTTTREYPIHQVPPTEIPSDVYVRLVNGVGLTLGGATIGSDNVRGVITSEDSIRAGQYFSQWQTWRIERGHMEPIYEVLIPRSDVRTVETRIADKGVNIALATIGILLVGFVIAMAVGSKNCPTCNLGS